MEFLNLRKQKRDRQKRALGLAMVIMAGLPGSCALPVNAAAAEEISEVSVEVDDYATMASYSGGFAYSDEMILEQCGRHELSPQLAKASVYLSMGAYDPEEGSSCPELYDEMGYELRYTSPWYSREMTYHNCDHAAFTVGRKETAGKVIYLVPVRGTQDPREWYSNLNIGSTPVHQGFKNTADEIVNTLEQIIREDDCAVEDVVVWLTGHSRGAAVANLAAAFLTLQENGREFVLPENVTAYTFACPGVTRGDVGDLKNIYNFNNAYDLIPSLPIGEEGWNYDRYGVTVTLSEDDEYYPEMMRRFREVTGTVYDQLSPKDIINTMYHLLPTAEDARAGANRAFFETMIALTLVRYRVGPFSLARDLASIAGELGRSILKDVRTEAENSQSENIRKMEKLLEEGHFARAGRLYAKIAAGAVGETMKRELRVLIQIQKIKGELLSELIFGEDDFYKWGKTLWKIGTLLGSSEEIDPESDEWDRFMEENREALDEIGEMTGIRISEKKDLNEAEECAEKEAGTGLQTVYDLAHLYYSGDPLKEMMHGHTLVTYEIWIDSMYF